MKLYEPWVRRTKNNYDYKNTIKSIIVFVLFILLFYLTFSIFCFSLFFSLFLLFFFSTGQVLMMVEDGRLESGGASAQKICLVAVTYHNIAVEQLLLSRVHEACVSSQNARRLARLSLSYSNRWLKNFEATHRMALAALSTQREVRTKNSSAL